MTYSINIYVLENQLIFTGILDMYFEKYKGIGPGYYSKPILVQPRTCSAEDVEKAVQQCVEEMQKHKDAILHENSNNDIMQMEKVLFQNFKLVGITASKSKIIKQSILILIQQKENGFSVCRCGASGRYMMVQKETSLPSDTPMLTIAQYALNLLDD